MGFKALQVPHQYAKNSTSFGFVDAVSLLGGSERNSFSGAAFFVAHDAEAMGGALGAFVGNTTWVGASRVGALGALVGATTWVGACCAGTLGALGGSTGAGAQAVIEIKKNAVRNLDRMEFTLQEFHPPRASARKR